MRFSHNLLVFLLLLSSLSSQAQKAGSVIFIKKGMSKIASKDTEIRLVADGFSFTEGPVWHKDGYLLFSDIPANKIMKYQPGEEVTIFMENSGYVGTDIEAEGPGSNGLTFASMAPGKL